MSIQSVSLWETLASNCWEWADTFSTYVRKVTQSNPNQQNYILGYSLGGRLALHALLANPHLWAGAIIVAAHPGYADPQKKKQSLERDRIWANRFLSEPWDDLLAEWDALPVFGGRPCTTVREESGFNRHHIAHAFIAYSKGHMDYLTPQLSHLAVPITYITGSDDQHYSQIGQLLAQTCPNLTHITIPDAGHRVPWEHPEIFKQAIAQALDL
ncbi:MAG: alpha/beta fold hydrolase [Cyanobacteria bacterium P01_D01_bin.156]